ncbi:LRR receptor-like serine/threonine-protein kinase FLS2 [Herrania umbratica]|uniref:LRR receptor-like serine/threonine-protein kinase FLS2 n=1 Tax=Herrania umbratica TaxID=108875 RepID=A0A6J1BLY3_9ROSI|nr:LRR receptor-like serine/threonine-protein kinase FLS2 [Herrania umbratica]
MHLCIPSNVGNNKRWSIFLELLELKDMANTSASVWCLFLIMILSYEFLYLEIIKFGSCESQNVSCIAKEREALLKFKDGLTDPSGRLSSWRGEDCCSWAGVQCSDKLGHHVTKLKLPNLYSNNPDVDVTSYALGGKIHPSLLDLQYLKYLDLSMNNFEGVSIPNFVGSLKTLRYLNLSGAFFGGPIPSFLGNLTNLHYLDLNSCFSDSNKNDLHWLSTLSKLKHLNLGSVDLSKVGTYWLQAVNMLPSLEELHLPACGLSILPLSVPLVNFSSLSVLDLSNNGFNSSIPSWLFNISGLEYLDLNSNNLRGEIPDGFAGMINLQNLDLSKNSFIEGKLLKRNLGSLCNLHVLDLSFNKITGDIGEFINGLSQCNNCSLESLHLGYNELRGILPDSLGHLRNLKHLFLMKNYFVGSIPESIGNLSSLEEFYLSENAMEGTIPRSLGQLSSLVSLDVKGNQWHGVITEAHFSNLTNLKELSIAQMSRNITLIFNVSTNWIPPFKLTYINLKSCQVGPKFPEWLRNQDELKTVAVWNAGISGTIPKWFWELDLVLNELDFSYNQLTGTLPNTITFMPQGIVFLNYNNFIGPLPIFSLNLTSFHLDHNMLSGPIPHDIGERMPMLADVDLSFNSLNGSIPSSIGEMSFLLTFVISDNQLTGKIPDIWNNIPDLYLIDMSNNSLSGDIPHSLGSLTALKYLRLSTNNLSGELSPTLQNCTLIETLDLGDNKLSGDIPTWIGETMPSLLILSLRSNMFNGHIPRQLCNLSLLHILDLGENNLSGSIPRCIGNMSGFSTIIKDNRYESQLWVVAKGRDLFYDVYLFLVNSIDLSSNNLSGDFPEELTNLSRLGTLNLSMNHLTGKISSGIGRLQWLETLDLSRNQLSGMIPPSMVSLTSLNHLNLSYNNLSGKIPSANQFQTFIDPSIYEGNSGLCGLPLPTKCNGDDDPTHSPGAGDKHIEDGDDNEMLWFYISMGPGFVVGFWAVCGPLIVKKSWRHVYFQFLDDTKERVMVFVSLKLARLRRSMNK